jgi:hypothetical protein
MKQDNKCIELDSERISKFIQFKDIPSIWTFTFMERPMWGILQEIDEEGVLTILGKRNRVVLARADSVIGVGMV